MLIDKRAVISGSLVRASSDWFACVNAVRHAMQPTSYYVPISVSIEDTGFGLDIEFNGLVEMTKWLHLAVAVLDRTRRKPGGVKHAN